MNYQTNTLVEPDLLRITATGKYVFSDLFGFIEFVAAEAFRAQRDKLLIDCSGLAGEMTEVERFEGGQKIAEVFGPRLKAALIMSTVTKLGEIAAVNRGARFFVTTSEKDALSWLRS